MCPRVETGHFESQVAIRSITIICALIKLVSQSCLRRCIHILFGMLGLGSNGAEYPSTRA
jgi:hypothetical protein